MHYIVGHDRWRLWVFDLKDLEFAKGFAALFSLPEPKVVSEIPSCSFTIYTKAV